MADSARLDSLRRRVQQDSSSIAFAQLAEEYRRAGRLQEAVDTARAGLENHPTYHSARVTLGRALLELNQFEDAQHELEHVLKGAPENLAAIKGLAEAHHWQGSLVAALAQYRAALAIARHDPDLEHTIKDLVRRIEEESPPVTLITPVEQANEPRAEVSSASLAASPSTVDDAVHGGKARALAAVAALEQWLHAVHVARAQRCA
jgi:tetratricopeptide (TPR) repeat protein